MSVLAAPDILRSAGVRVQLARSWPLMPSGPLSTDRPAVVWHHDASPPGASSGSLGWITDSYLARKPSAQFWLDTVGTWWCIGPGYAAHAGAVLPGMPGNSNSVGIETDRTVGEEWHPALLKSLRVGTAALLKAWGRKPSEALHFHKTIASPRGRKPDPDGLDLATERANVLALMTSTTPARPADTDSEELTMADISAITRQIDNLRTEILTRLDGQGDGKGVIDRLERSIKGNDVTRQELAAATASLNAAIERVGK